jgi:hypothetical protein
MLHSNIFIVSVIVGWLTKTIEAPRTGIEIVCGMMRMPA